MTETEELKVNIDKRGRICDKQGRPLRDKSMRNFAGPFKGLEAGKAHPRAEALQARRADFDSLKGTEGRKRPGSLAR